MEGLNVFLFVGNCCALQSMYVYLMCDLQKTETVNGCKQSCMQK